MKGTWVLILLLVLSLGFICGESKAETPKMPGTSKTTELTQTKGNLTVHFIDVGQGDSILVVFPNGKAMLVDSGIKDKGEDIVNYLGTNGISNLEYIVETHPHPDHKGSMLKVLKTYKPAQEYLHNGFPLSIFDQIRDLRGIITTRGVTKRKAVVGETLNIDPSVEVKVLTPPEDPLVGSFSTPNANSVVLLIDYGEVEILLTGDGEFVTENYIMDNNLLGDRDFEVLKVGHHGYKYSTSDVWLQTIKVEVGVISLGEIYEELPSQETLDRLAKNGVRVYRTNLDGTIKVTTDGVDYAVTTTGPTSSIKEADYTAKVAAFLILMGAGVGFYRWKKRRSG